MSGATVGAPHTMTARRARIAAIIATTPVASQEELGRALETEGVRVTQATLSRDLDALGAEKSADEDGHWRYVLPPDAAGDTTVPANGTDAAVSRVTTDLLVRAESAGNIAVLHTPPGAAQFFAGHLDRSTSFDAVGSVAGDDTVIVVMRSERAAEELCEALLRMADQRRTQ